MPRTVDRHTLLEDLQALLTGTLFISLGIATFKHAGLLTGALRAWRSCCTTPRA